MRDIDPRSTRMTRTVLAVGLTVPILALQGTDAAQEAGMWRSPTDPSSASTAPVSVRMLDVQGTIEATIDGQRMTFYSVSGESGDRPYSSSTWMARPGGGYTIALGGFITDEPPFDAFEWGPAGMPSSYGSYDGPVFGMALPITGEGASFTLPLPGAGGTVVTYQAAASLQDVLTTTYMMQAGAVEVTDVGVAGEVAHASGTFAGTFRLMSGEGTVEVADGRFSVEGIPSIETLRPGAG